MAGCCRSASMRVIYCRRLRTWGWFQLFCHSIVYDMIVCKSVFIFVKNVYIVHTFSCIMSLSIGFQSLIYIANLFCIFLSFSTDVLHRPAMVELGILKQVLCFNLLCSVCSIEVSSVCKCNGSFHIISPFFPRFFLSYSTSQVVRSC